MFRNAKYIYAVYREKSFSRAAESLYISQSSLSLTIKKAEERIGTAIFDRSTTPISLTEFGKIYIDALEELMRLENQLEDFIYDTEHINRGHIRIGAPNFYASYLLPRVLLSFRETYPDVSFDLYESTTADLNRKLVDGTIDLLITKAILDGKRFQQFALCHGTMVLAVPERLCPSEKLRSFAVSKDQLYSQAGRAALPLSVFQELNNTPFILLRQGNDTRECSDRLFQDMGIQPLVPLELDQSSTAYRLSSLGLGATFVSSLIIREVEVAEEPLLFPLRESYCEETVYAYMRRDAITPWAMEKFIKIARTVLSTVL